jgi:leader peptidase (prepilin peptidase)/N-methyltransferase
LLVGFFFFAIGAVVGSFINVCVYRIPFQKSVIWPASTCPKCWNTIPAWDNIPVFGWIVLRGRCRNCGCAISPRYPLVEALVGLLFVAVYLVDVLHAPRSWPGEVPLVHFAPWAYHTLLVALLVVSTFIDYDWQIIPDPIPITGVVIAIAVGTWLPWIRPAPATAATHWSGFWTGIIGLLVGGGLTLFFRVGGSFVFRKEAMGEGDVTLMAMIGAFLGWQAAILTFFLAPFFGLAHALWKAINSLAKFLRRDKLSTADHEIPFGPYLSMAAVTLVLSWPWLWPHWASGLFATLGMVSLWILGLEK